MSSPSYSQFSPGRKYQSQDRNSSRALAQVLRDVFLVEKVAWYRVPLDVVSSAVPPKEGSLTCPLAVTVAIPDDNRVLPVVRVTRILLEVDTISDTPLVVVALADGEVHGKSISGRVDSVPGPWISAAFGLGCKEEIRVSTLVLDAISLRSFGVAWGAVPGSTEMVHGSSGNSSGKTSSL